MAATMTTKTLATGISHEQALKLVHLGKVFGNITAVNAFLVCVLMIFLGNLLAAVYCLILSPLCYFSFRRRCQRYAYGR